MIKNFGEITSELSDIEKKCLPAVIEILNKSSKNYIIDNDTIRKYVMDNKMVPLYPARLRKLISFIRTAGILPRLLANSKGYYQSDDFDAITDYIESLNERIAAIQHVADSLKEQRNKLDYGVFKDINKSEEEQLSLFK